MNILEAIDQVLTQDISDDTLTEAIQAQVCAVAQITSDEISAFSLD